MRKLSVIIPVFNVEKYLVKCLESVLAQTYKDLEILLIDDGSTDNSSFICDEYQKKDKRIKVIHKVNGGISSARNTGIDIATGDFLTFVDSDDYIEKDMYYDMMQFSNEFDLIICGVTNVNEEYKKITEFIPLKNNFQEICEYSFSCNKIFKKDLFNNIKFPLNRIFEDFCIIPKIYLQAKKVKFIKEVYYNYYQRENSLSNKRNNIKMFDIFRAYYEIEEFLIKNNFKKELEEFVGIKKQFKNYFYDYFAFQSLEFKIKNIGLLKKSLTKISLWNFTDNIKFIFVILYPKYQLRKIYHYLKKEK